MNGRVLGLILISVGAGILIGMIVPAWIFIVAVCMVIIGVLLLKC